MIIICSLLTNLYIGQKLFFYFFIININIDIFKIIIIIIQEYPSNISR